MVWCQAGDKPFNMDKIHWRTNALFKINESIKICVKKCQIEERHGMEISTGQVLNKTYRERQHPRPAEIKKMRILAEHGYFKLWFASYIASCQQIADGNVISSHFLIWVVFLVQAYHGRFQSCVLRAKNAEHCYFRQQPAFWYHASSHQICRPIAKILKVLEWQRRPPDMDQAYHGKLCKISRAHPFKIAFLLWNYQRSVQRSQIGRAWPF